MRQLQKIDYSHFVIPLVKDPTEIHVLGVTFTIREVHVPYLRQKWWGHAAPCKEMIMNMSSLKGWARCAITARRIRENSTDYWGS
jgi:hypothetical protein